MIALADTQLSAAYGAKLADQVYEVVGRQVVGVRRPAALALAAGNRWAGAIASLGVSCVSSALSVARACVPTLCEAPYEPAAMATRRKPCLDRYPV